MTRTTILFGPPGTGKTSALLNEVDAALKSGTPPDRIAFFAFTRKAAREAVTRAVDRLGLKEDNLVWFRTLHSAAFKMLGLSSTEVMQMHHYTELAKALGDYPFQFQYNEDTERAPYGGSRGDMALGLYSRARSRCTTIEAEYELESDSLIDSSLSLADVQRFAFTLDDYKQAFQLLDFSDFLDEVHNTLDLDLLIVDEAQDLTRQQWSFVRRIGVNAKRVLIAGDDDQAIFQWAGADLHTFLRLTGDLRVLPVSYRLPSRIWSKATSIANNIRYRQAKEWSPRPGDEGLLSYVDDPGAANLRDDNDWLLLTRLRWQTKIMEDVCRSQGVVYAIDHAWSNQTPEVRAVVNYERLRRGEALTGSILNNVLRFIPGMVEVDRRSEHLWTDVKWPFEGMPDWMSALTLMGYDEREYIRRCRANNESLIKPGRINLSTIHGVKGGEADKVLILPDISKRIENAMKVDPDAEARVWYVATSRAKHHLMISQPTNRKHVEI